MKRYLVLLRGINVGGKNSRLSEVMGSPACQSMTIRSWATTIALLDLLER